MSFPELGWQYGETPDLFRLVFRDAMGKVIDEAVVAGNARSHRVSARVLETERFTVQVATLEDGSVGSNVLSTEIEVVDDRDLKSDLSALDQITELDRLERRLLRAELFEDAGFLFQWRLELTAAMALADPDTRAAISKELERQPDSMDEP